jgi:O-antigen chain-terminating methyltransferase
MEQIRESVRLRDESAPMREQHVSPFDEGEAAIDLAYLHSGYDTRNVDFAGHPAIPAPIVGVAKRVVQRLLSAALQPQVSYNAANTRVVTHIKDWLAALHRDSLGELRAVKEQMLALGQRLDQIEAQLEEQATAKDKTAHPVPTTELAVDYRLFEDRFRGSEADLTERQRSYVQAFVGRNNILDIGCGRGEFLELLRESGIVARGLDISPAMVERSLGKGLDVVQADAFAYLDALPDDSLGGVFAAQVIEHFPPSRVIDLVGLCHRKLEPGAPLILETPNPKCLIVFAEAFYKDPSHIQPVHPDTLQFIFETKGFREVEVKFLSPVDPATQIPLLQARAANIDQFNQGLERLNGLLFGFQDFAVIGRKAG